MNQRQRRKAARLRRFVEASREPPPWNFTTHPDLEHEDRERGEAIDDVSIIHGLNQFVPDRILHVTCCRVRKSKRI